MCYDATMGDWFVWYKGGPPNRSAFGVNDSRRYANFTDGLSNTMVFAECQVAHYQFRSCSTGPLHADQFPQHAGLAGPDRVAGADMQHVPERKQEPHDLGQWQPLRQRHDDGADAQHQGHPARLRAVPVGPRYHRRERRRPGLRRASPPTAITPAGVNILLGDGSVRFIKDSVNGVAWRALGTIAGGEVISADSY